MGQQP